MSTPDSKLDHPELSLSPETLKDVQAVLDRVKSLSAKYSRPILVALDGRSGSGKSTLAKLIAKGTDGVSIEADNFWAGGTNEEWDARTPEERSKLAIDWRRLRTEVLEPLLASQPASWHPFDFSKGSGLIEKAITQIPVPVIIIDGAYSSRPELEDIIDLKVLAEVPDDGSRRSRLIGREGMEYMADWHRRWDPAEEYYFSKIRNRESFDMIIHNH